MNNIPEKSLFAGIYTFEDAGYNTAGRDINHDLLYYNRPVHFIKIMKNKCFRERVNFRR
jgi:hypothetical protein